MHGGRERTLELVLYAVALACLGLSMLRDRLYPPPFEPGAVEQEFLRVATWNVGAGLEQGGLREEDLAHVADVLRALDPDLVFLQEVRSRTQGRRLLELLGSGWSSESSAGVLAACRRGRLEPFPLERAFRLRALGVVYHSSKLGPLAAVGMHAQAFSATSRNDAIGSVTTALLDREEPWKLLAGDLNLDLDLDKRRDLFTDDEYLDVETYNFVGERLVDAARTSGPTAEPDRRLDYVFVSPGLEVVRSGAWKGKRAEAMDHDPVVVDLRSRAQ